MEEPDKEKSVELNKGGTVEVRDGSVIVTNPEGSGKEAVISGSKGLKLYIDGKEVKESIQVNENSKISVEIETREPERKLDVIISDDRLCASVTVLYRDGVKFKLKDKPSSNVMVLDTESNGSIACPHFSIEEVKELLKKSDVVFGLLDEKLQKTVNEGTETPAVVAEGQRPIDETDDTIDFKFDDTRKFVEINNRVDFYSIGKVAAAEQGQLIAELVRGQMGKDGTDVTGKSIPFKGGKKIGLKAGKGAALSKDGLQVFGGISGRPVLKGDTVTVHEIYEVSHDVDLSTGNIEFIGDVVVNGDITEGMKVKAGNNVTVYGSVTGGEITAGGDVTVFKNAIGSKIKAGSTDYLKYNLIDIFSDISKVLMAIFSAGTALKETGKVPKIYKDGQIIKLLIDTKYKDLNDKIRGLRDTLADNKEGLDIDTLRLGAVLVKYFSGNGPTLLENFPGLKSFEEQIKGRVEALRGELKNPSNILAQYVQNSELLTSGSIVIKGKGCYTSDLKCMGDVMIDKIGSATRGGTINAGGGVKIYELGSLSGAPTTVCAGKESSIECETAHINSVVKVGEQSTRLDLSVKKLKAFIYKGELIVEKSKL